MNVELSEIINSPGLWIASSIMVIAVIVQAVVFFISGHREANRLEIPKDVQIKSMRSAMITSIGPSIAMVVIFAVYPGILPGGMKPLFCVIGGGLVAYSVFRSSQKKENAKAGSETK